MTGLFSPDSVCIIRLSAIGDCCNVVPVLRTLQASWPDTRITWIVGKTEASLVGDIPGVEFIVFDKKAGLSAYRGLRRTLRGRRFDLLLHMHASMRANLVSRFVRSPYRLGFDRERARDRQWLFTNHRIEPASRPHVLDGFFGFAEHCGIAGRVMRWDIPLADADRAMAADTLRGPALLISPCSSQRLRNYRNWRVENYARVATHAARVHGLQIVLTGGNTGLERRYAAEIAAACETPVTELVGQTSLKQLLALIERATVVLCPDSGPAHMATAAGTPVIGLYATSNPGRTGPYLSQQWVVNRYPEAVAAEFGKDIGDLRWGTRVRDPRAMDLIATDDVIATLDRLLQPPTA